MTTTSGRGRPRRKISVTIPPPSRLKLFRPISWHNVMPRSAGFYVSHVLQELGRLGIEINDIERNERPPSRQTVLSDLIKWQDEHPGKAFAKLVSWQMLDIAQMIARLKKDGSAKPRIELSAYITKMNNLSVCWHPGGWKDTEFDWEGPPVNYFNLIPSRKWLQPSDFRCFVGDEEPTFDSRASNELMYIRGVGNLRPKPRESYGPYATYNDDVVDSILICAVRSAYEDLIRQLEYSFEVDVINAFDFVIHDEIEINTPSPSQYPVRRVVAWSLEDANELRTRREQEAAVDQDRQDRSEFANINSRHGFALEVFIEALDRASSTKSAALASFDESVSRETAKNLRSAGFKVDVRDVRRIRQLIERYNPELLPDALRPPHGKAAG
ncbi:hypothetical protein [Burkholderia pyrrocinia]|uniref:hypothetical protein n=1 Tax=Burkholderia pyrrocinia TaxID=60550 RepID=UPI0030D2AACF